jgi:type I restriction enzyme S subunit
MSKWPLRRLNELIARLECGARPKGGVAGIADGVPSLGGEHINKEGGVDFDNLRFIPEEFFNQMGRGIIQRDDILVVKDGATTGKTAFVGSDFPYIRAAINEHVFLLRTNRKLMLPRFLFFYLFAPWGQAQILSNFHGAAIGGISQDFARSVEVPVPSLSDQERIVWILDEAEELRSLRAQADQRVAKLIPALFDKMFGDLSANSRNWPIVDVSSLVERFQAGRSIASAGEETANRKYRILKISAVTWGRFAPEESKPVPDTIIPAQEHFVRAGDMLFSRANTTELVGATVLVETTPDNLLLPDKLWRFVWKKPEAIEPRFALALFQHPAIRLELGNRATGTGGSMKNLSMGKVLSMKIPLPPLKLQRTFAVRVAEIRDLETTQAASRQHLDNLFQSLLQRAFQGEL